MYIKIDNTIHEDIKNTNYTGDKGKLEYFGPISKLNILVGANNSGKSRFLRGVIKTPYSILSLRNIDKILQEFEDIIKNRSDSIHFFKFDIYTDERFLETDFQKRILNQYHRNFIESKVNEFINFDEKYLIELCNTLKNLWKNNETNELNKVINKSIGIFEILLSLIDNPSLVVDLDRFNMIKIDPIYSYNKDLICELRGLFQELNQSFISKQTPKKIYIPILRTANGLFRVSPDRSSEKLHYNIFENTVRINFDFNELDINKLEIFTGLDLYQKIKSIRNGKLPERKNFKAFESFLNKHFFNRQVTEIVSIDSNKEQEQNIVLHFNDEDEDRNIHLVGDGIQQIIIMMYPVFTASEGSWIFIEEPEINLHPGLQRVFLEQLIKHEDIKKKNLTIFITTHSNHLLDLSLEMKEDVSIFTFEKLVKDNTSNIHIRNVKNSDTDILKLLGVNNSSVFMANCSIWVEGISDRIYLRTYLKAFNENFPDKTLYKEDLHYSFFEYAGSNVSHYIFLSPEDLEDLAISGENFEKIKAQFLSNKIFLIADKDSDKDVKHDSLAKQVNKNFEYYPLPVREVENLLTPVQIRRFLTGINFKKKITTEEADRKQIEFTKYKDEYLGKYLMDKFNNLPKNFKAKSGTIETVFKTKIAEFIAENIKWSEMSNEAQQLTTKLYNFIELSNT